MARTLLNLAEDATWPSWAAGAVLLGNGTAQPNALAPGASGNLLTSNGSAWVSQAPSATLAAGTSATPAQLYTAGTNMATPSAGAKEYDGNVFYQTPKANERHVIDGEQFATLSAAYTLTSQTAAQKLLNASASGAVTLQPGAYFFDCMFTLSALSATSGGFGFALGGAAVIAGQLWQTEALKAALATAASAQNTVNTAANTAIVTASTATVGWAHIWGKIRISTAGTLIPQISLGVAAAAIVGVDSYFRIWPVGLNTVVSVGNWS